MTAASPPHYFERDAGICGPRSFPFRHPRSVSAKHLHREPPLFGALGEGGVAEPGQDGLATVHLYHAWSGMLFSHLGFPAFPTFPVAMERLELPPLLPVWEITAVSCVVPAPAARPMKLERNDSESNSRTEYSPTNSPEPRAAFLDHANIAKGAATASSEASAPIAVDLPNNRLVRSFFQTPPDHASYFSAPGSPNMPGVGAVVAEFPAAGGLPRTRSGDLTDTLTFALQRGQGIPAHLLEVESGQVGLDLDADVPVDLLAEGDETRRLLDRSRSARRRRRQRLARFLEDSLEGALRDPGWDDAESDVSPFAAEAQAPAGEARGPEREARPKDFLEVDEAPICSRAPSDCSGYSEEVAGNDAEGSEGEEEEEELEDELEDELEEDELEDEVDDEMEDELEDEAGSWTDESESARSSAAPRGARDPDAALDSSVREDAGEESLSGSPSVAPTPPSPAPIRRPAAALSPPELTALLTEAASRPPVRTNTGSTISQAVTPRPRLSPSLQLSAPLTSLDSGFRVSQSVATIATENATPRGATVASGARRDSPATSSEGSGSGECEDSEGETESTVEESTEEEYTDEESGSEQSYSDEEGSEEYSDDDGSDCSEGDDPPSVKQADAPPPANSGATSSDRGGSSGSTGAGSQDPRGSSKGDSPHPQPPPGLGSGKRTSLGSTTSEPQPPNRPPQQQDPRPQPAVVVMRGFSSTTSVASMKRQASAAGLRAAVTARQLGGGQTAAGPPVMGSRAESELSGQDALCPAIGAHSGDDLTPIEVCGPIRYFPKPSGGSSVLGFQSGAGAAIKGEQNERAANDMLRAERSRSGAARQLGANGDRVGIGGNVRGPNPGLDHSRTALGLVGANPRGQVPLQRTSSRQGVLAAYLAANLPGQGPLQQPSDVLEDHGWRLDAGPPTAAPNHSRSIAITGRSEAHRGVLEAAVIGNINAGQPGPAPRVGPRDEDSAYDCSALVASEPAYHAPPRIATAGMVSSVRTGLYASGGSVVVVALTRDGGGSSTSLRFQQGTLPPRNIVTTPGPPSGFTTSPLTSAASSVVTLDGPVLTRRPSSIAGTSTSSRYEGEDEDCEAEGDSSEGTGRDHHRANREAGRERVDVYAAPSRRHWQPDREVDFCALCQSRFNSWVPWIRKHHCRMCGGIFCGSCSSSRVRLTQDCRPDVLGVPSRVCDACVRTLDSRAAAIVRRTTPKPAEDTKVTRH